MSFRNTIPVPVRIPVPAVAAITLLVLVAGCGRASPESPQSGSPAAIPQLARAAAPHGDHNPHHGGVVLMKGEDLHYEVVLDPSGRSHRLFFTDAVREDLPASIATDVSLTIRRPGEPDERVVMQIDDAGESWIGTGRPVRAPAGTSVRVAFAIHREPYWIDIQFTTQRP